MRFITEFEYVPSIMQGIKERECRGEFEIGQMIGESFGWKVTGTLKSIPDELVLEKHQLEIEAFPMDKWVEFKEHLLTHIKRDTLDMDYVRILFKNLESFDKSSGDAITNQQLNK